MFNDLANKAFRNAFLAEHIRVGLAFAIRAIRESRGWTQGQLAEKAKKPASVISRLEDPNYGRYTIKSLLDLAQAFDVALLIKFVPYSRFISELKDLSPEALAAVSYTEERQLHQRSAARNQAMQAAYQAATTHNAPPRGDLLERKPSGTEILERKPVEGSLASLTEEEADETTVDQPSPGHMAFPPYGLKSSWKSLGEGRAY